MENSIIFNTFAMKYSELRRILLNYGCYPVREGANHEIWFSPVTKRVFPVARHWSEEVYKGTLKDILKQSGIKL